MNKKKVDSILKAAAVAGVAMGVGAFADVNVVYADEVDENLNDEKEESEVQSEDQSETLTSSTSESSDGSTSESVSESSDESTSESVSESASETGSETEDDNHTVNNNSTKDIESEAPADELSDLDDLIGDYSIYGDTANIKGHMQSDLAANNVNLDGKAEIGSDKIWDKTDQSTYIGNISDTPYTENIMPGDATNKILFSDEKFDLDGDGIAEQDKFVYSNEDGSYITSYEDENGVTKTAPSGYAYVFQYNESGQKEVFCVQVDAVEGGLQFETAKSPIDMDKASEIADGLTKNAAESNSAKVDVFTTGDQKTSIDATEVDEDVVYVDFHFGKEYTQMETDWSTGHPKDPEHGDWTWVCDEKEVTCTNCDQQGNIYKVTDSNGNILGDFSQSGKVHISLRTDENGNVTQRIVVNLIYDGADEADTGSDLAFNLQKFIVNNQGSDWDTNAVGKYQDAVIFNFGRFSGKVNLSGSVVGTVLAPDAEVTIYNTGTGKIVADTVTIDSGEWHSYSDMSTSTSQSTSGSTSESQTESESQSESETESGSQSQSESETESGSQSESESETESGSQSESESQTESGSQSESQTESESQSESQTESGSQSESETESGSQSESETESESQSESQTESESQSKSETESESQSESQTESESESESTSVSESESTSTSVSESESGSTSESESGSTSISESESTSKSTSISESESTSESTSTSGSTSPSTSTSTSPGISTSESTSTSSSTSTSESTSLRTISDDDVPLAEIPDDDVPLADLPDAEIPDDDVPLADLPDEDVPLAVADPDEPVEIPDDDVPLGDRNPETGDSATLTWLGTAAASLMGIFGAGKRKKKEDDEQK